MPTGERKLPLHNYDHNDVYPRMNYTENENS